MLIEIVFHMKCMIMHMLLVLFRRCDNLRGKFGKTSDNVPLTIVATPCYTLANNQPTTLTGKSSHAHGLQRVGGWCEAGTYAHGEWTHESQREHRNDECRMLNDECNSSCRFIQRSSFSIQRFGK